jgi:23S rRNA pseudouridine2605 synthase
MAQKRVKPVPSSDSSSLSKYIAQAGHCSRRNATEFIKQGIVTVNEQMVTEPGHKLQPGDVVRVNEEVIKEQKKIYVLLNKPKDYITTASDEKGRKAVMDLFNGIFRERLFPVGRLDRNTTGLLLLTNDGILAQTLTHPRYEILKVYAVTLDRPVGAKDIAVIRKGVTLEDGHIVVDEIHPIPASRKTKVKIILHSGKNRIVRRIFEHVGYDVRALDREEFAGLTKSGLPRGQWRYLTDEEIRDLHNLSTAQ